jgi:hypothetical protein
MGDEPIERRKPNNKKMPLLIGGAIALLVLTAGALFVAVLGESRPIPKEYADKVSFPLYYPDKLPAGFARDTGVMSANSEALVYGFRDQEGKRLVVTIQARPAGLSVNDFNPTKEFGTHIGRAYVVDLDGRSTAAIVNDTSLVVVNAPEGIALSSLETFVNSLRRIEG